MERNYKMDNIKAFLIFLVVLGHLLELVPGQKSEWLYYVIYTFHMPAFVYITGYFSRPDSGKRFFTIVYTYIHTLSNILSYISTIWTGVGSSDSIYISLLAVVVFGFYVILAINSSYCGDRKLGFLFKRAKPDKKAENNNRGIGSDCFASRL